ncbi:MAG: ABC transporter substrate-binding protein [Caldilineaceae bacterium]|nr:ABC transporter substrate-binding protein [Caldilineaceae bacterium]
MKPKWFMAVLATLSILLLSACSVPAQPAAPASAGEPAARQAAAGSVLRVGWSGSPDSLNPGVAVLTEAYTIYGLVYSTLYRLNLDGTYSLDLAERAEVSEDGKTWTFTLRAGATFHDGEPVTASDVAFSFNLYKNTAGFPFLPVYTDYFESVEAVDERTVVIKLSEAIPNMESQLYTLFVLPEHVWGGLEGQAAVEFQNLEMIGSGPFKLVEYSQNQFVRLETNRDFYGTPAKIDGVVFQTFDNADALVQALRTGQVDMITEMPNTAVAALRNDPNVQLVAGPPLGPGVTDIILNVLDPEQCPPDDGECTGHPALLDLNVRLALAHATDKQQIIDVVLLGLGSPGLTLIPDGLGIWYNNKLEDYAFDIALANKILDDAGYADTDGDGVREMPDGSQSLVFRMNWPSDSNDAPRMAEILSSAWAQIGVKAELQALDPDALTAICCPTFDFDVILWGWGSDPDPSFLLSVMTTDEIPTGTSETGYSNPEYDALYRQQGVTLDVEERKAIVWKMQEIVHKDLPYIIPYYAQSVQAFRTDRFRGWITDGPKVALEDQSSLMVIEPVR